MAAIIYSLCAIAALLCTILLFRAYRRSRSRLLLWSTIGFAGLTINNLAVVIDEIMLPFVDLSVLRNVIALISMMILLWGLIWEAQ